ncbi:MAG: HD domain-containing protein [Deltaproteobacteria bacterium]|nr:HD domain-containing protein [Deltaproteobacteria bacterium]
MARAYDLVMGKKKSLTNVEPQDESAEQTETDEAALAEARLSLRLSEIDILKLKSGNQQEIPIDIEIEETNVIETTQASLAIETAAPELPMATATQTPSERQDDQPIAEATEEPGEDDRIRMIYVAAKQYMGHVRNQVRKGESFQLEPALIYINNVLHSSHDMTSQIYQLTVDYEQEDDYYLSSPINTLVYGLKVAQRMGYSESKLIEFGLAALLHDIGMFRIPDNILNKAGRPSDSEMDLIKSHPEFAVEIMAPFAARYPKMIRAVYEHQERANGQGYPRGLKGDEICDYAQIIGICDSYEAMTHHRPHKKPLLQSDSIKELIGSRANLFEPRITKMFLDEISMYPIGSYVRLNNRNIGRVVATNKTNPMKPVVNLIFDEKGIKLDPPRMVDLRSHPVLNIEDSVSVEDLPAS